MIYVHTTKELHLIKRLFPVSQLMDMGFNILWPNSTADESINTFISDYD